MYACANALYRDGYSMDVDIMRKRMHHMFSSRESSKSVKSNA
jgi:hypothetical protein